MQTPDDLARAVATAFAHTRPGGVALFVPDGTAETFAGYADHGGHDGPDGRALRYLEWAIDPDPEDALCEVHFACLLREKGTITLVHDRHVHGLFTADQWRNLLGSAGFVVTTPSLDEATHEGQVAFLARRPL